MMRVDTIKNTIKEKAGNTLNVYFTAGFPHLESTAKIIRNLSDNGVDLIELGLPYSDPLADGTTIQDSSQKALKNGISLDLIFNQVEEARQDTEVPIIMMGYYNQMLQYGIDRFTDRCQAAGINGLIIPDLPMNIYERDYHELFQKKGIAMSFLITPLTSDERIRQADRLSSGFIYIVSQTSITGKKGDIQKEQVEYFDKLKRMDLRSPGLIGFGIHDHQTYKMACQYSDGAIIGSEFIRVLGRNESDIERGIKDFIQKIRG